MHSSGPGHTDLGNTSVLLKICWIASDYCWEAKSVTVTQSTWQTLGKTRVLFSVRELLKSGRQASVLSWPFLLFKTVIRSNDLRHCQVNPRFRGKEGGISWEVLEEWGWVIASSLHLAAPILCFPRTEINQCFLKWNSVFHRLYTWWFYHNDFTDIMYIHIYMHLQKNIP